MNELHREMLVLQEAWEDQNVVFLQAAHALMSGRMTRTEILAGWLEEERPFAAGIMRIFFHLAGVFVFVLIAQGTWPKLFDAWVENEFFGAQGVFTAPVWPIKACLFGGSILTTAAFAVQALKDIKDVANSGRVAPLRIRHSVVTKSKGWVFVLAFACLLVIGYGLFFAELGRVGIGVAAIGFMLLLIFSGAHIAVVLILLSFLGIWLIRDNPKVAMRSLALAADGAINRYLFGVVPLFVLTGLIVLGDIFAGNFPFVVMMTIVHCCSLSFPRSASYLNRRSSVHFVVHALDKRDALPRRLGALAAHQANRDKAPAEHGVSVLLSGPLMSDDGERMTGSFFLLDAPNRAAIQAVFDGDAIVKTDVWETRAVTSFPSRKINMDGTE